MATKVDTEASVAATAPLPTIQENVLKKSRLLALLFLLTLMAGAALAVGCVALVKANDVDKDLDRLQECGDPVLLASYALTSIFLPSPSLIFVPAWDYADLIWFGTVGNRMVYNAEPVFLEGTNPTVDDPVGTVTGDCMVTNPVSDLADIPGQVLTHCFLTVDFADGSGTVAFGGTSEFNGNEYEYAMLGGTGDWENFRGVLKAQYDVANGVFSAKLYQTCA